MAWTQYPLRQRQCSLHEALALVSVLVRRLLEARCGLFDAVVEYVREPEYWCLSFNIYLYYSVLYIYFYVIIENL